MKKKIIFIFLFSISNLGAQIGVGTVNPQSQMDISPSSGSSSVYIGTTGLLNNDQSALNLLSKYDRINKITSTNNLGWQLGARGNNWTTATQRNSFQISYWNGTIWKENFTAYPAGLFGINNSTPQATLDIKGDPTTSTTMDGLIPPRITGNQLQLKTYTINQNGAIIYVTQACSSPSGQTQNVTTEGLYIFNFNQNKWILLSPNSNLNNIFCNNNNPNSATIFDTILPPSTDIPSTKNKYQYNYFGLDGSCWIWDGSNYILYNQVYSLVVGQRISVFKTLANSVANNTILSNNGLIELDGIIRIDVRKIDNTYYSPRILNISGTSKNLTYSTFSSIGQNKSVVNTSLGNNVALEVDADNLVFWSTSNSEFVTTNLILPNGRMYEVQWMAYEVSSTKQIFMTVIRKF